MAKNVQCFAGYRGAMAALLLSILLATLAVSSVNILLPELMVSLHTPYANVQWVVIAYMITLSSFLAVAGRLGDIYGRRTLFVIGIVIFTLSAGLCGVSQNIWMLSASRALQGIGAAILVSLNLALVRDIAPQQQTGRVMGLAGSLSAAGTACGPVFGGLIAGSFDWHWIFWLNIPLGLVILVLAIRYLPQTPPQGDDKPQQFDLSGAVVLALIVIGYALSLKPEIEIAPRLYWLLPGLTLALLALFVRIERIKTSPLLHLSLLSDYQYSLSYLTQFIVATVVMTSLIIGPFYLTAALGLTLSSTGLVMASSPVCVAITSHLVGRRLKEETNSRAVTIGILLLSTGALCLSYLSTSAGIIGYIACLMLTAVGYGMFTASNNTQLMTLANLRQRGQVSGLLNLSRTLGLLTGATLMSNLFNAATQLSHDETLTPKLAELGLNRVYAYASMLLCVALALRGYWHRKEKYTRTEIHP